MMTDENELLDLVDDNDRVIGTILRSEFYRQETNPPGNIRAIDMFIQNDQGELWIPTRTAHKTIAPNALDYSCGGHVSSGEGYLASGLREIQEELNLILEGADLQYIHTFRPTQGLPYFRALFLYRSNTAPAFNPADFVSAEWLAPEEILEKIAQGIPAKGSLAETVRYLQTLQSSNSQGSFTTGTAG